MSMNEFGFALGEVVSVAPSGIVGHGTARGRVVGQTRYLDGSHGYVVSIWSPAHSGVIRHLMAECELVGFGRAVDA